MNVVCRENGIDFATGSTKDYRNGFFFALFVIFVAKHPSGRGSVVSGSEGWISPVGYRWVTLGNGNVLAENRFFPPYAGGGAHALPSKAGCRKN